MTFSEIFFIFFISINIFAYAIMWLDKIKSIYGKWRISEKFLWILAIFGWVFGIWLGMQAPLYHKAWKNIFKILVPMLAFIWILVIIFLVQKIF